MTTCLFSLLTAGADRMAQTDPHGWTLTLISVCVVFCALLILYGVYSLSGDIFSGKFKRKSAPAKASSDEQAIAAAIALALSAEGTSDEEIAALAALSLYLGDSVHDIEPGFITIRKNPASAWGNPQFNFRKYPRK
jgi:Na+-transporting methylmalonyl-CoA/oxaloacetate decarboxylase gamma subunit